jgi:hypothetical protein
MSMSHHALPSICILGILLLTTGCKDQPSPEVAVVTQPSAEQAPDVSLPNDEQHRIKAISRCLSYAKKNDINNLVASSGTARFVRMTQSTFANSKINPGNPEHPPSGWVPPPPQPIQPSTSSSKTPSEPLLDCWRVSFFLKSDADLPQSDASPAPFHVFMITNDGSIEDLGVLSYTLSH